MVYDPWAVCVCGHTAQIHEHGFHALEPYRVTSHCEAGGCTCLCFTYPSKPHAVLPDLKPGTLPVYLL